MIGAEGPDVCKGDSVVPEQRFGPLVARQAAPGLEAINSRGGTLGNVAVHGAYRAAHSAACIPQREKVSFVIFTL